MNQKRHLSLHVSHGVSDLCQTEVNIHFKIFLYVILNDININGSGPRCMFSREFLEEMQRATIMQQPPPALHIRPTPPLNKSISSDRWPRSVLKVKGDSITGGPHARSDQCTWIMVERMNPSALISLDTFPHLALGGGGW